MLAPLLDGATALGVQVAWLLLHCFFLVRSLGRAAVDQMFHLMGLAFLEPRRGLMYAMRKLQRLMVRRERPSASDSILHPFLTLLPAKNKIKIIRKFSWEKEGQPMLLFFRVAVSSLDEGHLRSSFYVLPPTPCVTDPR